MAHEPLRRSSQLYWYQCISKQDLTHVSGFEKFTYVKG